MHFLVNFMIKLHLFYKGKCGTTSIEYALIASIVSIFIIVGVSAVGTNLNNNFYSRVAAAVTR